MRQLQELRPGLRVERAGRVADVLGGERHQLKLSAKPVFPTPGYKKT